MLLPNQCCVKFPCEQCDYITTQPPFFAHSLSPQSAYSTILAQTRTGDQLSLVVTMPTPSASSASRACAEWKAFFEPLVNIVCTAPADTGQLALSPVSAAHLSAVTSWGARGESLAWLQSHVTPQHGSGRLCPETFDCFVTRWRQ